MDTIIRQCYGIDISKLDFSVCFSSGFVLGQMRFNEAVMFSNNRLGFNQFLKWSRIVDSTH